MTAEWIRKGDAVLVPNGRVGMLYWRGEIMATVQFDADGPFEKFKLSSLRWATRQEIRDAGLSGVGFNERIK